VASTRSPTRTRCCSAAGKGNGTSSASHHFAFVYTFIRAFLCPKRSVCPCAREPSLRAEGLDRYWGCSRAGWQWRSGPWTWRWPRTPNTTGHHFTFSLNLAKVTICHFLVFLPWTGEGFSQTVQMRWCRGNIAAQHGVREARCPAAGMPAGTSKLRCIICPAPSFCWWEARVSW